EDQCGPVARRGGGDDRAGRLRRGARRRADRRRRPCVGRGTGSVIGRSYGTSRTRVDFGSMNLDIIAQLVQILKDAPELGAIEVRRGLLGRWSSIRVTKAGHGTNAGGQHVVVAQPAAVPPTASGAQASSSPPVSLVQSPAVARSTR